MPTDQGHAIDLDLNPEREEAMEVTPRTLTLVKSGGYRTQRSETKRKTT